MSTAPVKAKPALPTQPSLRDVMPSLYGADAWGEYQVRPTNFFLSLLLHTLAAGLVLASANWVVDNSPQIKQQLIGTVIELSPYVLPPSAKEAGGGGGGGDRDKLAASKGNLPKLSDKQFVPPTAVIRNLDPKLAMEPTVVVPPEIRLPQGGQLGDPLSAVLGPLSNGTGSGSGIGSGSGGGVGSGSGPGVGPGWGGGIGGGAYRVGGGVSAPRALYSPEPEYSEEARKAKYQGVVVLWLVVGPDGRPRDIRVSRSLGLGLDEKAIEAVRQWKFEPARKDGKPVPVQINVEVSFRLY